MTVKVQHESVAHYQLLEPIGAGALGELFRARDTRLGRSVAVRIVSQAVAGDADARRRLLEATARAAALSHPSLAATYEAGDADGRLYLVTEYVPGEPLTRVVSALPLHPKRALEIAVQIADALAELHAADLVHGDVQPGTIRITPRGQAKLIDTGLAAWTGSGRLRSSAAAVVEHGTRTTAETLAWMSPEQALGERIDHRSDLFSLGSVLHLMITGTPPFAGDSPRATILNVVQLTPPAPSEKQPDVPAGVDRVLKRALSKSLDGRYESAATFAADLRELLETLNESPSPPAADLLTLTAPSSSRSSSIWVIVLVLVTIAAAVAWYLSG